MPATGPVQAGGDQGRDFESFHTYLAKSPLATSSFVGLASDEIIVGAVTLNKQFTAKIKSDLKTIFGAGRKPDRVVYFSEQDIPVYKRHKLQKYCNDTYSAALDIFDGQAIATILSDRDTSWIADEYLSIPSELWPTSERNEDYINSRDRWLIQAETPENYADFLDLKRGLRMATFVEEARHDLRKWIDAMRSFLTDEAPDRLKQKARYEIAVAELRGNGSLDPALSLVETFLANATSGQAAAELLDAAVLILRMRLPTPSSELHFFRASSGVG